MLAKEASIGDIIDIPSNVGHNPWEVISLGHPKAANAIEVKPIFENTFPQRYDNYHLDNSALITVRNPSTIEFNDQKPEYLYEKLHFDSHSISLNNKVVTDFINKQINKGYELVSVTSTDWHYVDVLMVKYG